MYANLELEQIVIELKNQILKSSGIIFDERFSEAIDKKRNELPVEDREEFMEIAEIYGYASLNEREEANSWIDDSCEHYFDPEYCPYGCNIRTWKQNIPCRKRNIIAIQKKRKDLPCTTGLY